MFASPHPLGDSQHTAAIGEADSVEKSPVHSFLSKRKSQKNDLSLDDLVLINSPNAFVEIQYSSLTAPHCLQSSESALNSSNGFSQSFETLPEAHRFADYRERGSNNNVDSISFDLFEEAFVSSGCPKKPSAILRTLSSSAGRKSSGDCSDGLIDEFFPSFKSDSPMFEIDFEALKDAFASNEDPIQDVEENVKVTVKVEETSISNTTKGDFAKSIPKLEPKKDSSVTSELVEDVLSPKTKKRKADQIWDAEGWKWRKHGHKPKRDGSSRSYFRCSMRKNCGCAATLTVDNLGQMVDVDSKWRRKGQHNHVPAAPSH